MQCCIGLGLSIGKASQSGHNDYGTAWGAASIDSDGQDVGPAQATWNVTVAFGSYAFAYSYSLILIEIQDSLAQPPSEAKSMKKATTAGVFITVPLFSANEPQNIDNF